jgi:aminopeptidase N
MPSECRDGFPRFELPGAEPHYAPDRTALPEHLRIEVGLDFDKRSIRGRCTTRLKIIEGGPCAVTFDAVDLEIDEVGDGSGAKLPFTVSPGRLRVDLGERTAGGTVEVAVGYRATPRRGLYFVEPDQHYPKKPRQAWTQGQDVDSPRWFPCIDQPGIKATSEVIATVPRPFSALANGELVGEREGSDGTRTFHWKLDVPHSAYLVTLVAGELESWKEKAGPVELDFHVPKGRMADGKRAMGNTARMMAFFTERLGVPYPYKRYGQVCVADFIFGGMENTTQTTLTDQTLHDERAHLDFTSDPLVSHELAHQWFGDLVTCRTWADGWLNEGFATYFEALWREHDLGEDEFRYEMLENADLYLSEMERYARSVVTSRYHEPVDIFDRHLYEKGSLILHMVRGVLGDERFFRAVKRYLEKHARGAVETRDLLRAVEEATGAELSWLFEPFVHGRGHPQLEVGYAWDPSAKLVRLEVKQTQKVGDGVHHFRLPMQLRLVVAGETRTFDLEVGAREMQSFAFPAAVEPTQCVLDPKNWMLKTVRFEKPVRLWREELGAAPEGIVRAIAARALGKQGGEADVPFLEKAILGDKFWGVAAQAAGALGQIRGPAARDALIRGLAVKHPKARRAVVRALGEFREDPAAAGALLSLLEKSDASYFVEGEAARSLGKTRDPRAWDGLVKVRERPSHQEAIRCGAIDGIVATRDERALKLLVDETRLGLPMASRRAATAALGELEGKREARERLEDLIDDPDFRIRHEAALQLGRLGDAKAIPLLERIPSRKDEDGRVKRRARESVRKLGEGKPQAMEALRGEVDALRRELNRVREELAEIRGRTGR